MRDKTHTEHIERWAEFVKTHPRSVWIKEVKPLIQVVPIIVPHTDTLNILIILCWPNQSDIR